MLKFFRNICGSSQKRGTSAGPAPTRRPAALQTCKYCNKQFQTQEALDQHAYQCGYNQNPNNSSMMTANSSAQKVHERENSKFTDRVQVREAKVEYIKPKDRMPSISTVDNGKLHDLGPGLLTNTSNIRHVDHEEKQNDSFISVSMSMRTSEDEALERFVAELKQRSFSERRAKELQFVNKYIDRPSVVKYIISEDWIDGYTSYLNGEHNMIPGPVNNKGLKEKLDRRSDKEIYAVNETLWKFVMKMYGGGPSILQNSKPMSLFSDSDKLSEARTADTSDKGSVLYDSYNTVGQISTVTPVGMKNELLYCYINASIQVLLGIESLAQYTATDKFKKVLTTNNPKFWTAFSEVTYQNTRKAHGFTPKLLRKIASSLFDPRDQHDAHEFIRFFLSGLQDEQNLQQPKKPVEFKDPEQAWEYYKRTHISIIDDLFAGQLISKVTCYNCSHTSVTFDPFHDIALPIIPDKTRSIDQCMNVFLKEEEIKDSYRCERCKSNAKITKKFSINKFPRILLLQLKRFQSYPVKKKLKDYIEFPVDIMRIKKNNEDYNTQYYLYNLIGVVVHIGPMDSGHYVSFSKRGKEWYLCDDESIKPVIPNDIISQEVYLLMYERSNQRT